MSISDDDISFIQNHQGFNSPDEVIDAIRRERRRVCVVNLSNSKGGTGFLIGPALVLTNYHVVAGLIDPEGSVCRFDYADPDNGDAFFNGREVAITSVDLFSSKYSDADARGLDAGFGDFFDYAILELGEEAGNDTKADGTKRGWVKLFIEPNQPRVGHEIFVLQHPKQIGGSIGQQPLRISFGRIEKILDDGRRIRHNAATRDGSSGSPIFSINNDFSLLALHNVGDPDHFRGPRQAIPIWKIAEDISKDQACLDRAEKYRVFAPPLKDPDRAKDNQVRQDAIIRHRKLALCLMGRFDEEFALLGAIDPPIVSLVSSPNATPIVHVFASRANDGFELFRERIEKLSLNAPSKQQLWLRIEALKTGKTPPGWFHVPLKWPEPIAMQSADIRMTAVHSMFNFALDGTGGGDGLGNRLLVFSCEVKSLWDIAKEREFVAAFAKLAVEQYKLDPKRVQIIIHLRIKNDMSNKAVHRLAGMWMEGTRPPYCGVCIALGDIDLSQMEPWKVWLAKALCDLPQAFESALRLAFGKKGAPLQIVADKLIEPLDRFIEMSLDRSPAMR